MSSTRSETPGSRSSDPTRIRAARGVGRITPRRRSWRATDPDRRRTGSFSDAGAGESVRRRARRADRRQGADGLAAGKGVVVAATVDEACGRSTRCSPTLTMGEASARVVVEDFLAGEEASSSCSSTAVTCCRPRRRRTTSGCATATQAEHRRHGRVLAGAGRHAGAARAHHARGDRPTVEGMAADGIPYTGFPYAGVMIDAAGAVRVLVQLPAGRPETQPIMARLKTDLVDIAEHAARGARLTASRPSGTGARRSASCSPPHGGSREPAGAPRSAGSTASTPARTRTSRLPRRDGARRRASVVVSGGRRAVPASPRSATRFARRSGATALRGDRGDPLRRHAVPHRHRPPTRSRARRLPRGQGSRIPTRTGRRPRPPDRLRASIVAGSRRSTASRSAATMDRPEGGGGVSRLIEEARCSSAAASVLDVRGARCRRRRRAPTRAGRPRVGGDGRVAGRCIRAIRTRPPRT